MARTRALGAGVRCAVFSDEPVPDAELVLPRPLRRADVVSVLNVAGAAAPRDAAIAPHGDDFYVRDLGEAGAAGPEASSEVGPPGEPATAAGLDDALRPTPPELREKAAVARAEAELPQRRYATREDMLEDTAARGLREFLEGDL